MVTEEAVVVVTEEAVVVVVVSEVDPQVGREMLEAPVTA